MTAGHHYPNRGRLAAVAIAVVALAGCQAGGGAGGEKEFPTEPINLVVGFSPGGGSDVAARVLAQAADGTLPEQVVVENREGAGGASANAFVRGERADGYTILIGNAGSTILTPIISESPQLKWDNFAPVARIHAEEEFLFLLPNSRWQTIADAVDYARQNPGKVRVGGSAVGGVDSFVSMQIERAANIDLTYIPFDGGGPAIQSFLGGNVDILIGNLSDTAASVEAGKMIPVAVASEERGVLDDVPTLVENGWDVVLQQWRGILAPKDTPRETLQILADAFKAAMSQPAWTRYRETSQSVDMFLGPQEFAEFLRSQEERFVPMIEELDLIGG
jgi:tripartite-type tricarboxylate transporter receptor subunit TctC